MNSPSSSSKKSLSNHLVSFVEACGRHPFATGLFALLGVAGLIFSVYSFSVDRDNQEQSSRQASRIEEGVGDVRDTLDSTAKRVEDVARNLEQSPTSRFPKLENVYLDSDENEGKFLRFIGKHENEIVNLSVSFPGTEDRGLVRDDEDVLSFRQKDRFGEAEYDYTCHYIRFLKSDEFDRYRNWDSGYWHVTGFFRVLPVRTQIADYDCMVFIHYLEAIPLTNENTSIM